MERVDRTATGRYCRHVMNANQYAEYQNSVADFLRKNDVKPGCHSPKFQEPEPGFEPFFSWRPCECCGSGLGGSRETYTFATEGGKDGNTFEADICTDCVYYLAYGQLDDSTMMEIEASA